MANLNKIIVIGRLVADPEMRFTVDGSAVTKYRLAVNRPPRSDGSESGTDFIPIVSFGRVAEISGEYLKKGKLVLVEGRIQVRSYSTDGGQNKWVTEVIGNSMKMLDKSDGGDFDKAIAKGEAGGQTAPADLEPSVVEDDIPF